MDICERFRDDNSDRKNEELNVNKHIFRELPPEIKMTSELVTEHCGSFLNWTVSWFGVAAVKDFISSQKIMNSFF